MSLSMLQLCIVTDTFYPLSRKNSYQVNAYPPKPIPAADMYTSYNYGDNGLTVTLVVNTFRTQTGEAPRLDVKIVIPVPSAL